MNYAIVYDGTVSGIEMTHDEPDDYYVFATFKEAKTALIAHLQTQRDDYRFAIDAARKLRQRDVS